MDQAAYIKYVEQIRSSIADGWVYQVNACRVLSLDSSHRNLRGLFSKLLAGNPAPWASYLEIPGRNIASASPELFLQRKGSIIKTSPIKGTQRLDETDFGRKDKAENVMIVDLMRNDFGKICESGSVEVPRLLASEDHPGLRHLVSDIEGVVRNDISWREILESLSPPGSISGAPKSSAISVITEHEEKRGPYCGVLGWVQGDQCELSVAIRIFWQDSHIHFGTGAGITWGSDPVSEWEETQLKARRLISIAGGVLS
jgi:para-aminobenzoate synthetase component 1